MPRQPARRRVFAPLLMLLGLAACEGESPLTPEPSILRPRSAPIEYVGLTVSRAVTGPAEALAVIEPIFGIGGSRHAGYALDEGLSLSSTADARGGDQSVVTLEMSPTTDGAPRTILRAPVSGEYGQIFASAVRVALTRTAERTAADPDGMRPWHLEYRSISANGGYLEVRVSYEERAATLLVTTENPRTSLRVGEVNTAAYSGDPHEVIGGTVWFELSRDEFDFFSSRAYGVSSGRDQNFEDFQLLPHDWLRITVTPQVEDGLVDVAFDVVLEDGRRIPFARSPASYVAGEQFRQNVFRMVDNMMAAEAREPGSSSRFTVPFHYDDPAGGGVVRVIATGQGGVFNIAYAVDSPVHALREVEFVPYVGDPLADHRPPEPPPSCEDLGSAAAPAGRFELRFDASSTVRNSTALADPLRGDVRGSIFRAEDVTITGPNEGAEAVASFRFDAVDIEAGLTDEPYLVDVELPAGDYQILGFMDIDGNGVDTGDPDEGDPVTLPIGGYTLECATQPVTVEFALLLPAGV